MEQTLSGQTAIVTGGCRGIGKAIVESFLRRGAKVFALDYVLPENGCEYIEDETLRQNVRCIQVDVTKSESVSKAIDEVVAEDGKIDILVNNAGITRDGLILKMNEQDWDSVLSTNLKGETKCFCFLAGHESFCGGGGRHRYSKKRQQGP